MDFPAVIAGEAAALRKLATPGATHVDGHAPGVSGHALNAYLAAGIASDHEATTYEEALEKRRKGAWILIREASNARNLEALLPLVLRYGPERCAFCTDDREADVLLDEGHIDGMCRAAVRAGGLAVEDALVLATHNGAACHGLAEHRRHRPGLPGRLLPAARRRASARRGSTRTAAWSRPTARRSRSRPRRCPGGSPTRSGWGRSRRPTSRSRRAARPVRVIELVPDQLLTESSVESPRMDGGLAVADPERDLAKIAVVERHHASGRIGRGFVRGFGLREGALASTVSHDAHNLIVVGASDDDMEVVRAAPGRARRRDRRGARQRVVLAELALPVAGLMSDRPSAAVAAALGELRGAARSLGVAVRAPFMALSFLGLSVIPSLKITDRGLIDVDRFEVVSLEVEQAPA